jgi:hypothetical protein
MSDWGSNTVVDLLPSMHEALALIPKSTKRKKEKQAKFLPIPGINEHNDHVVVSFSFIGPICFLAFLSLHFYYYSPGSCCPLGLALPQNAI